MPRCSVSMTGPSSVALECDCLADRFGNAADHRVRERRYPSDMTGAEWAEVRPLPPVPGAAGAGFARYCCATSWP